MKLFNRFLAFGATVALATSAFALTSVTADITTNTTWTVAGSPYILSDVIYVKNGAILDIEPGVVIRGEPRNTSLLQDAGSLIITRGSKIQARGTAAQPIIFTTAATFNSTTHTISRYDASTGDPFLDPNPATAPLDPLMDLDGDAAVDDKVMRFWGGVVLAGYAQTNNYQDVNGDTIADDGEGLFEGLTGADATYGGTDDLDNSGVFQYVSIRHGGDGTVADKELNALTLYSVGSGTTVSYVDVYCTSDDGVEVFGGTVNLDHLNINYADDDGFDTDEGYRGTAEFIFVLQGHGYGDHGMELDGDDWDEGQALAPLFPISDVQIRQATVVMRDNAGSDIGVLMRNGFNGALINSIVWKQGTAGTTGVRVEPVNNGVSFNDVAPGASDYFNTGSLQLRAVTVWNFTTYYNVDAVGGDVDVSSAGAVTGTYEGVAIPSVYYPATNNRGSTSSAFNPEFTVTDGVTVDCIPNPAKTGAIGSVQPLAYVADPATFASYRGAFDPNASQQWTFGWTALNIAGILAN